MDIYILECELDDDCESVSTNQICAYLNPETAKDIAHKLNEIVKRIEFVIRSSLEENKRFYSPLLRPTFINRLSEEDKAIVNNLAEQIRAIDHRFNLCCCENVHYNVKTLKVNDWEYLLLKD